jgi:hypothetical protein
MGWIRPTACYRYLKVVPREPKMMSFGKCEYKCFILVVPFTREEKYECEMLREDVRRSSLVVGRKWCVYLSGFVFGILYPYCWYYQVTNDCKGCTKCLPKYVLDCRILVILLFILLCLY